jgi:hypothetical protein
MAYFGRSGFGIGLAAPEQSAPAPCFSRGDFTTVGALTSGRGAARRRTRHTAFRSLLGIAAAAQPPRPYKILVSPEAAV